jgi:nitrogen-specific signal transduction histidine kinase
MLAHELRNPLSAITASLPLIERRLRFHDLMDDNSARRPRRA